MDIPRTLPPLVRGKVTGVLNFFIDDITLNRNVLTENFDIIAQVQWWGEIIPTCIRPKILQLQDKIRNSGQHTKAYSSSAKYEIKTTMDLLKLYLNACEVLELSVYETDENYVIGSAFLKDLCNLLNRNNESIFMPIIDYSGEEIGQIKIHIDFFEYPQDNKIYNTSKVNTSDTNLDTLERRVSELFKTNYIFPAEKTIFYDSSSKVTNFGVKSVEVIEKYPMKDKNASSLVLSNYESEINLNNNFTNQAKKSNSKNINLPKVCVSTDSSKILSFELKKESEKNTESKLANKFSSNSINCKSKLKNEKSKVILATDREKIPKETILRSQLLKQPNVTVTNHVDLRVQNRKQSKESFGNKNIEVESVSQTSSNKMVYDYLLGSVMSKQNEEIALRDFKKMSPSQDIVSSINELCLTSGDRKVCANKCMKCDLCFDLTNPIERNYYEKFFVKNNVSDFEIAELLNEREDGSAQQKWKSNDGNIQRDCFKTENCSVDQTLTKKCDNFQLKSPSKMNKITNNCARCKYYKKLEELDTIIESLKHFEKNILKQEKNLRLEFEDNLTKQDCKVANM